MNNKPKNEVKIFQAIQKSLAELGYYRPKSIDNFQRFNSRNLIILTILTLGCISTSIYFFYEAKEMLEYAQAMYSLATSYGMIFVFWNFLWKMKNVNELIVKFEKIIRKRSENPKSKEIYDFVNKMIEKWSPRVDFVTIKMTPGTLVLPNLITVLVARFTQDTIESDIYRMAFPFWVPYNWKTFPIGYMSIFLIEYVYVAYVMQIVSCMSYCFFIGSGVMVMAICEDIKQDLQAQRENLKNNENPAETHKKFYETVLLASTAKELLSDMTYIYEFNITAAFLWGILTICGSLLIFQMEMEKGTIRVDVALDIVTKLPYSFVSMLFICELGEQISTRFDDINEIIYQMDWYLFPSKIQRSMPLILQASQQPVGICGYGNFPVARDTFKRIANCGFSYFMIFRNFR